MDLIIGIILVGVAVVLIIQSLQIIQLHERLKDVYSRTEDLLEVDQVADRHLDAIDKEINALVRLGKTHTATNAELFKLVKQLFEMQRRT